MSRHARNQLRRDDGAPRKSELKRGKSAAHDSGTLQAAGNRAIAKLFDSDSASKPLPGALQSRMEQAFGTGFQSVRVHDDATARAAAESVNARAFAHGEHIVLGSDAPALGTPESETLLAHELAHVVQQREAAEVRRDDVSRANDGVEAEAQHAAAKALAGERAGSVAQGAVPAVLRDGREAKKDESTRDEARQALQEFLERAQRAKPDIDLRRSEQVRSVLESFVLAGGPMVFVNIREILGDAPNNPAEIARRIAGKLPDTYPRAAIERLKKARAVDDTPSLPRRVADLAKSTAPAKQQIPPGFFGPTLQEQSNREVQMLKELTKTPAGRGIGPYSVDVLRLARIAKGLPKAIKPEKTRDPGPAPRSHPDVEAAVQAIPADMLIPADAKGTEREGDFADAQEVAREIARQIDIAQQSGQDTVSIRLAENYKQARDRTALRRALEDMIARIRAALPHHGSSVTNVDVYFGDQLVTRGRRRSE